MKSLKAIVLLCLCFIGGNLYAEEDTALLVQKGELFVELVRNRPDNWYKNCHAEIFSLLDKLTCEKELLIDLCDGKAGHDVSDIYVKGVPYKRSFDYPKFRDGIFRHKDNEYMDYVALKEVSASSCWQWVLLSNLRYILPTFWHGSYIRKKLILTEEDYHNALPDSAIPDSIWNTLEEVEAGDMPESKLQWMKEQKIEPLQVSVNTSANTADVIFCTWNDWQGLKKNHYQLFIKKDRTVEVRSHTVDVIVPYSCGLLL